MNFVNFFLVIIVAFIGLVVGLVIGRNVGDEVKQGKKWFIFSQRLIVLVIVGLSMFYLGLQVIWIIAGVFLVSTAMYQLTIKTPVFYALFGVFIGLLHNTLNPFLIICGLVFLYGIVSGSMHDSKSLMWFKYIGANAIFFVSAVLMWFA